MRKLKIVVGALCVAISACASTASQPSYKWTQFVQVDGQPEPIPAEWVSTPEGKFAHSLKIPNPVPKDSGYKPWMSSEAYFKHLCEKEAGEFIFKTVENIEGVVQIRPIDRPSDEQLKSRWTLESPELSVGYAGLAPEERFVWSTRYRYFEARRSNWNERAAEPDSWLHFSGYNEKTGGGMLVKAIPRPSSRYGFTWRGIRRPHDRENGIAGGEMIVIDQLSNEVLAIRRAYLRSGTARGVADGIWWLNGQMCINFAEATFRGPGEQVYSFVAKVLKPTSSK